MDDLHAEEVTLPRLLGERIGKPNRAGWVGGGEAEGQERRDASAELRFLDRFDQDLGPLQVEWGQGAGGRSQRTTSSRDARRNVPILGKQPGKGLGRLL